MQEEDYKVAKKLKIDLLVAELYYKKLKCRRMEIDMGIKKSELTKDIPEASRCEEEHINNYSVD